MKKALEIIKFSEKQTNQEIPHELIGQDLMDIQNILNEITGEVTTEDILNEIFSTFCIGK